MNPYPRQSYQPDNYYRGNGGYGRLGVFPGEESFSR
jgi:hypothetical protein